MFVQTSSSVWISSVSRLLRRPSSTVGGVNRRIAAWMEEGHSLSACTHQTIIHLEGHTQFLHSYFSRVTTNEHRQGRVTRVERVLGTYMMAVELGCLTQKCRQAGGRGIWCKWLHVFERLWWAERSKSEMWSQRVDLGSEGEATATLTLAPC